jgi:hypothetical protein
MFAASHPHDVGPALGKLFEVTFKSIEGRDPLATTALLFVGFIALGYAVFLVREWSRDFYGIMEVIFGFATAAIPFLTLFSGNTDAVEAKRFALYASLLGGFYVIVRGVDNIDKAIVTEGSLTGIKAVWQFVKPKQKPKPAGPTAEAFQRLALLFESLEARVAFLEANLSRTSALDPTTVSS